MSTRIEWPQGGGEVPEAELIALVAGPYHYHHKMDEAAEREGKAFDRCRELTIQNIRTWCATRRAMRAAAPPSAPVGVAGDAVAMQPVAEIAMSDDGYKIGLLGPLRAHRLPLGTKLYASPEAALAQQPAAVGVDAVTALRIAHRHLDMDSMRVSHCKDASAIEAALAAQQPAAVDGARPLDEWHEDDGPVVWWKPPVDEPAWIGTPLDSDWPGYHTHWTPHPAVPALAAQPGGDLG